MLSLDAYAGSLLLNLSSLPPEKISLFACLGKFIFNLLYLLDILTRYTSKMYQVRTFSLYFPL